MRPDTYNIYYLVVVRQGEDTYIIYYLVVVRQGEDAGVEGDAGVG